MSHRGQYSLTSSITTARVNNQITAPELRVITAQGENLGVISRDEALARAREAGMDLIEIAPTAKPPVARIMSFDKYRYQKEKEEKKERQAQKASGMKQVQISARAGENDLLIKAKQADEFLAKGHHVEVRLRLRGREKRNRDWAMQKMKEFATRITVPHKVVSEPKQGGFGISMQVIKQ